MNKKMVIGSLESCDLPELNIVNMEIRVDTGAKTSSLHVDNIKRIYNDEVPWVEFDIHPDIHDVKHVIRCQAKIEDIRTIKSSNGTAEERYVIVTPFTLGKETWPIEITLTDRSDMSYLMLFGRQGMGTHVMIDPSKRFIANKPSPE